MGQPTMSTDTAPYPLGAELPRPWLRTTALDAVTLAHSRNAYRKPEPGPAPGAEGTTPNHQRNCPTGGGEGNDRLTSKGLVQSV